MRSILIVLIILFPLGNAIAEQNAQLLFDQANTMLEENNFAEALKSYRNIEELGEVSGPLFLNMGIAAMEIDSLGLAKFYFLQAKNFNVTRTKAVEALEFVNSQFSRQSAILPKLPWDRAVDHLKEGIGASGIFILGLIFIFITITFIIANWFYTIQIPKKTMMLVVAISLSCCTAFLAFYVDYVDQRYKDGVIVAKQQPVTTQPIDNADLVSIAYEGYSITVDTFTSEHTDGWYYIRLGNGQFGWIQTQGSKIL